MYLNDVFNTIKDYIFPIFCLGCKKEGQWLCQDCFCRLDLSGVYFCPICHKNQISGTCCQACRNQSFVESEIATTIYHEEEIIGQIIHTLKYGLAEDILLVIEKIIEIFFTNNQDLFKDIDCIVPVPLHKKRFAERGFNQAELIAHIVSKQIKRPVKIFLQRTRHTPHQTRLSREERLKNVLGAFTFNFSPPRVVLLIDDVYTTGSTIQECARELKKQGVEKVYAFTLARG